MRLRKTLNSLIFKEYSYLEDNSTKSSLVDNPNMALESIGKTTRTVSIVNC